MVRLGEDDDVWIRVEAPDVANPPELCPEQVRLGDGEEGQQGNGAGQLERHDPKHGRPLPPLAVEGLVAPVPLRVPVLDSFMHLWRVDSVSL